MNFFNRNKTTTTILCKFKKIFRLSLDQFKNLKGDPHYIAIGMAVGVFIAITPTIPFHTVLALLFASIIKGSKMAAVLGVWLSNPLTIPFFYWSSYKLGWFVLGHNKSFDISHINHISEIMKLGFEVTLAMLIGGFLLGIIPSILTYFITKWICSSLKK